MNVKNINVILFILIFCLGCNKTPTQIDWSDYRGYLSASDFKKAIIGKWKSVFEAPGKENIEYLELSRTGKAKIVIKKNGDRITIAGDYSINFPRPPEEGIYTFAELIIEKSNGNIILSRVYFGSHDGVSATDILLRNNGEPHLALKKTINTDFGFEIILF